MIVEEARQRGVILMLLQTVLIGLRDTLGERLKRGTWKDANIHKQIKDSISAEKIDHGEYTSYTVSLKRLPR